MEEEDGGRRAIPKWISGFALDETSHAANDVADGGAEQRKAHGPRPFRPSAEEEKAQDGVFCPG